MCSSNKILTVLNAYGVFRRSANQSFPITAVKSYHFQPSGQVGGRVAQLATMVKLMPEPSKIIKDK